MYDPQQLFARLAALGIAQHTVEHPPVFTVEEAKALKRHAKGPMKLLWAFDEAFRVVAAQALEKVAYLVVTADVALKIFAKAATPSSPAMRLMGLKKVTALMKDEIQKVPR